MRFFFSIGFLCSIIFMIYFLYQGIFSLFLLSLIPIPVIFLISYFDNNRLNHFQKLINKQKSFPSFKKIKYSRIQKLDKIIVELPVIKMIYNFSTKKRTDNFERSIYIEDTDKIARKSVSISLFVLVLCIVIVGITYHFYQNILSFVMFVFPVLIFFHMSVMNIDDKINKRKNIINDELFFFVIFCGIIDETQSDILKVFRSLTEGTFSIFPAMQREANMIKREMDWFGKPPSVILHNLCENHPSTEFKDFILGYLTSENIGGNRTGNYIETKINALYKIKKSKIESYIKNAGEVAPMIVFGLSLIPMFLMVMSMFKSGSFIFLIIFVCIIFIPIIIIVMIKKIDSIIPLINNSIPFRREPIIVSLVVIPVCVFFGLSMWEIVAYPLIVWSFLNHFLSQKIILNNKNFETSIPRFTREMNQLMVNWDFDHSFKKLAITTHYNHDFDKFLKNSYNRMNKGENIEDVLLDVEINSWISKLVIQLVSFTAKKGEVKSYTMEKLSDLSETWYNIKTEMMNNTIMALVLGYISPIVSLLLIILVPSLSVSDSFDNITGFSNIQTSVITDRLMNLNYTLLFVIAFFGMLMVVKIRTMTIHNSIHVGIIMIVMCVILYFNKYVGLSLI